MHIYIRIKNEKTPLGKALRSFVDAGKISFEAWRKFGKKHGANGMLEGLGLLFEDEASVPPDWRFKKRIRRTQGHYVPRKNTPGGKAIIAEMAALPHSRSSGIELMMDVHHALWPKYKGNDTPEDGPSLMLVNKTGTPALKETKDGVIHIGLDTGWLPPRWLKKLPAGLEEIKATEYENLK